MTTGDDAMIYQPSGDITVQVPKNPDERLALDIIQAVWPRLGYLHDAPPQLRMEVKIALSNTVWDTMRYLRFDGPIYPVDPIAGTLFGYEVVANNWARDRVEIVIPVSL